MDNKEEIEQLFNKMMQVSGRIAKISQYKHTKLLLMKK